jgi:hypothetical protein
MVHRRWSARYALVALVAMLALVLAACGGDGDDATATPDQAQATAAVTPTQPTTAATPDASPPAAGTPAATPTQPAATATPTTAASPPAATPTVVAPTPTTSAATATATAATTPTAAALATATPDLSDPFADVEMLDPELLPNFTLEFELEMSGIPEAEEEDMGRLALEIRQSAIDNYHMRFDAGDVIVETWLVDGTTYLRQEDGTILSIPGGETGMFSPSMFLTVMPTLDPELRAARMGEESVSGRQATHFRITGADYLGLSEIFGEDPVPSDITGDVNVWIDNELNIMLRQDANLAWTNADGTRGTFVSNYLISDIGSTGRVDAPQ